MGWLQSACPPALLPAFNKRDSPRRFILASMRKTLSIAMIAMNEEANLPRTLESVRWADEIVIVDSGSTDRTLEIAHSFGAKTMFHPIAGHGEQKNVALDLCTSDWILLLDADEVLTPELQQEIRHLLACEDGADPKFGAYWIPRLNLIFGRWVRHGGFYPDRKLRLFKRGSARLSEGVGPHSTPQFQGPKGKLKHDMLHYAYPSLAIYLEHMNRYSSEIARLLHKKGRTSNSWPVFLWNAVANPAATFIYNYFFRLGFSGWARGSAPSSKPFRLHPLEVHQSLAARAAQGITQTFL